MKDTMKAPVRINAREIKALNTIVRQHLLNAEYDGLSAAFSASELRVAAEMLARLALRLQTQYEITRIQSFPQPF